jgi:hypothetical protein
MHKVRGIYSQKLVLMQLAQPKGPCRPQGIFPGVFSQVREAMVRGSDFCCSGQVRIVLSLLPPLLGRFLFYFIFSNSFKKKYLAKLLEIMWYMRLGLG